jgi:allophanate hydrolase
LFSTADSESLIRGVAERLVGRKPTVSGDWGAANESATEAMMRVAVCGLHMRGFPLEKQMQACGARFVEETYTAARYRLLALATTPAKPGLIKLIEGGESIVLEVWEMPVAAFGGFTAAIPAPLGIGKVELADGTEVSGFICEAYAEQTATDITAWGGWRAYQNQRSGVTS